MQKKILVIIIIIAVIFSFQNRPGVIVSHSKDYTEYSQSLSRLLKFENIDIEGVKVDLKTKGSEKHIKLKYEFLENGKISKTEEILQSTVDSNFNGFVNVVLVASEKENEARATNNQLKLLVDFEGGKAAIGKQVMLPDFLSNSGRGYRIIDGSERYSFGDKIVIYEIYGGKNSEEANSNVKNIRDWNFRVTALIE